jgi:hypothetical protein
MSLLTSCPHSSLAQASETMPLLYSPILTCYTLPFCHMKNYGEGLSRRLSLTFRFVTAFHNRFLTNLKLVAVDELHYYHGLFGRYGNIDLKPPMHTANLLFAVMSLLFCGGYGESAQPWAVSVYTVVWEAC